MLKTSFLSLTLSLLMFSSPAFAAISLPSLLNSGYKAIASGGNSSNGGGNGGGDAWVLVQKGRDFKVCIISAYLATSSCQSLK